MKHGYRKSKGQHGGICGEVRGEQLLVARNIGDDQDGEGWQQRAAHGLRAHVTTLLSCRVAQPDRHVAAETHEDRQRPLPRTERPCGVGIERERDRGPNVEESKAPGQRSHPDTDRQQAEVLEDDLAQRLPGDLGQNQHDRERDEEIVGPASRDRLDPGYKGRDQHGGQNGHRAR